MSLGERLYRLALRTYPTRHRSEFLPEMLQAFRALDRDRRARGGSRYVGFLLAELHGVLFHALRERWSTRLGSTSPAPPPTGGPPRKLPMFDTLLGDLRYAVRTLRKSPAFTAVVVVSLALGIGSTSTIFSVTNQMLLTPLPFADPDRLVTIFEHSAEEPDARRSPTRSTYLEWRAHSQTLEQIELTIGGNNSVVAMYPGVVGAGRNTTQVVSPGLFSMLGVDPVIGRHFTLEDAVGRRNLESVILSHEFWLRDFGGDPGIVGETWAGQIVAGVMPPGFWIYPWGDINPAFWTASAWGERANAGEQRWLEPIGRLKPGVSIEQAQAELDSLARALDQSGVSADSAWRVRVEPLHAAFTAPYSSNLFLLWGGAGLVLLIACCNVASLLIGRVATRQREMTTRAALGAGRSRLMRQLLTESLVLAVAGGTLGVLLAHGGTRLFVILAPPSWYLAGESIRVDGLVLGFTLGISVLTAVLVGLAPARWASKPDLAVSLRYGMRSPGGGPRPIMRSVLVGSQIALAFILVAGAGLMLNSLVRLNASDPGFDPDRVLTAEIYLEGPKYTVGGGTVRVTPQVEVFYRRVLERLRAQPGVETAETLGRFANRRFTILGDPSDRRPNGLYYEASPGFFRTMGIPLVKGRFFTARDTASSPWVAIIDETVARGFFPDEDPIGKVLQVRLDPGVPIASDDRPREIVGVVGVHRRMWLQGRPDGGEGPSIFVPTTQYIWQNNPAGARPHLNKRLFVRTTLDEPMELAPALRAAVAAEDTEQAVFELETMAAHLGEPFANDRFWLRTLGILALLAIVLAVVGIYGVMAYAAARLTHEIGVRMALGAQRGHVLAMVLRQGLVLSVAGVIVGVLGALAATRLIASQLYGVEATDPATFAAVAVTVIGIALVATHVPARRATRVDPVVALRSE